MKNVLVGQSGGPSAVINCSLYGIIKKGMEEKETVNRIYGMINGIEGCRVCPLSFKECSSMRV